MKYFHQANRRNFTINILFFMEYPAACRGGVAQPPEKPTSGMGPLEDGIPTVLIAACVFV
jgi:hypothetical protein